MLEARSRQSPGNVTWQEKISVHSSPVHHMAAMRPHGKCMLLVFFLLINCEESLKKKFL